MKSIIRLVETIKDEENKIRKRLLHVNKNAKILDIGCGYGEKIRLLKELGFKNVLGVEKNEKIVEYDLKNNIRVVTVEAFREKSKNEKFDLIVMSHIIEHFQYNDLKNFMEHYLEYLCDGGYLLIVTPVYHSSFYDDFDHVKPYYPTGINMVFGNQDAQVQFYSKCVLRLEDIYFRRAPFRIKFLRAFYIKSYNKFPRLINIFLSLVYKISFGVIGRTTGWIGLYKKVKYI